ncbi:MAG TPA: MFS transporter [Gemmatimonadales bacterium]|nr:MFS transporter [Gemmatimonadales bacterium]
MPSPHSSDTRKLAVLMTVAFVDMVGLVMIVPLLPFYATDFGANATMVGILISAFSVAQLVSAPLWGRLSDTRGRRPAIITGLLVSSGAYVIFGLAGSIVMLLLSRLIQGTGGGTIGVVQAYVADASAPEDRAKALGWLSAVTSLGAVVGPALGSVLSDLWGRHAPGFVSAGLCALVALFARGYLEEPSQEHRTGHQPAIPRSSRTALVGVLRHDDATSRLIWIYTIAIGAFYGTVQIIPLLMAARFHVTERNIGYFVMYLGGMGVVARAGILGWMVDRFREARLSQFGLVLLGAGLMTAAAARTYPVLFLSMTLMPLGTAFLFPCITGLLSRVVASHERGLYLGVQQTFGGISRVAFPVGAGLLIDRWGTGMPFWISGALVLLALGLTGRLGALVTPRVAPA